MNGIIDWSYVAQRIDSRLEPPWKCEITPEKGGVVIFVRWKENGVDFSFGQKLDLEFICNAETHDDLVREFFDALGRYTEEKYKFKKVLLRHRIEQWCRNRFGTKGNPFIDGLKNRFDDDDIVLILDAIDGICPIKENGI